jgi:hypothetical protein
VGGHEPWADNTFRFALADLDDGRTRLRFRQAERRRLRRLQPQLGWAIEAPHDRRRVEIEVDRTQLDDRLSGWWSCSMSTTASPPWPAPKSPFSRASAASTSGKIRSNGGHSARRLTLVARHL